MPPSRGKKRQRRRTRSALRDFDSVTHEELRRKAPALLRQFRSRVAMCMVLHIIALAALVAQLVFVPDIWTPWIRVDVPLRLMLLTVVAVKRVDVIALYGVNNLYKIARFFASCWPLHKWLLLSYWSFYVVSRIVPFIDVVLLWRRPALLAIYLTLDIFHFVEFRLCLRWIYIIGVRRSVRKTVLRYNSGDHA